MKAKLQPLKPYLLGLVAEGREAAAAPFAPAALRERLCDLARLGVDDLRITPRLALDVRGTKTAEEGLAYLKGEGIEWAWDGVPVPVDEKRNPGRSGGEYYELIIRVNTRNPGSR